MIKARYKRKHFTLGSRFPGIRIQGHHSGEHGSRQRGLGPMMCGTVMSEYVVERWERWVLGEELGEKVKQRGLRTMGGGGSGDTTVVRPRWIEKPEAIVISGQTATKAHVWARGPMAAGICVFCSSCCHLKLFRCPWSGLLPESVLMSWVVMLKRIKLV